MAKRYSDHTYTDENGVKVTVYEYRGPRKGERTYDPNKGKYSVWNQGSQNLKLGARGATSTLDKVGA